MSPIELLEGVGGVGEGGGHDAGRLGRPWGRVNGRCARILTASRARKLPWTRLLARKQFEGLDAFV